VRSPHLIAMIGIFPGANRALVALHLDKNDIESSFSLCMLEEVVNHPAHELVPALRSSLAFMSTCTVDSEQESSGDTLLSSLALSYLLVRCRCRAFSAGFVELAGDRIIGSFGQTPSFLELNLCLVFPSHGLIKPCEPPVNVHIVRV
jgi:hypothetical protein